MQKLIIVALVIIVLITMGGCNASPTEGSLTGLVPVSQPTTPVNSLSKATVNVQPTASGAYPAPMTLDSSYPSPHMDALPPINVPSAQVTVIRGQMLHDKPQSAAIFPNVYLADVKFDDKGNPMVASLDRSNGVKAIIDKKGNFAILNVTPNKYILIIDLVESMLMLNDDNGKEKILTLEGGKILDVGIIHIP